jgi:hypothetical protein
MTALSAVLLALLAAAVFAWRRARALGLAVEQRHVSELARQQARRESELRDQALRNAALFDRMVEGVIVLDAAAQSATRTSPRANFSASCRPPPAGP